MLKLADGVAHPDATLAQYVVTEQLARCFDTALDFIHAAVDSGSSKATYLHGSFGSGKSHFMAVLHLLLKGDARALNRPELAPVVAKHRPWLGKRRLLLVPYHMLGAGSLEERVFEDYCRLVERLHPEAKLPTLFDSDALIADAERLRQKIGDPAFFGMLGADAGDKAWGALGGGWDAQRYGAALAAKPGDPARQALATALVDRVFPGSARDLGTVRFDQGLELVSQHAQGLGYDGVVLFLDELILWLASKAATPGFLGAEIDKIVNLVEAQRMDRPIPIVSFIARQRDLRELIGRDSTGAQQLAIEDKLSHHQGRFQMIELSTTDLPEIASRRLLQPRDAAG
ncbi:MAG: hypothetical protein KC457_33980, partial [Myxococcales bacterium]|nr:hypothetical protein [Myxococcales bacterium]